MPFTFKCDYCGEEVTKKRRGRNPEHRFCGYVCAAKWRVANGHVPVRYEVNGVKMLPHDDVRIRVTEEINLFPEFQPKAGNVYEAERYHGQYGLRTIGYVILVNGHRVNIRAGECVEV